MPFPIIPKSFAIFFFSHAKMNFVRQTREDQEFRDENGSCPAKTLWNSPRPGIIGIDQTRGLAQTGLTLSTPPKFFFEILLLSSSYSRRFNGYGKGNTWNTTKREINICQRAAAVVLELFSFSTGQPLIIETKLFTRYSLKFNQQVNNH